MLAIGDPLTGAASTQSVCCRAWGMSSGGSRNGEKSADLWKNAATISR